MPKRAAAATKNASSKRIKQENMKEDLLNTVTIFQDLSVQLSDWIADNTNQAEDLIMRIKSYVNIQLNALPSKIADMPISFFIKMKL